ncbi:MAG: hypothetical protein DHS20C13_29790 [Thermodesulfobacteriota bacterium]|nr:MAG: hypothetical protein DHS20C13_29790 [Thermodesulfobacteriota bacterium]
MGIILYEIISDFYTNSEKLKKVQNLKKTGKIEQSLIDKYPYLTELIAAMIEKEP